MKELRPIGLFFSNYQDKAIAPRQGSLDQAPGFLQFSENLDRNCWRDLEGFERIWLIYAFHQAQTWSPTVNPPRGGKKRRGVFSTRSPYRPNPIGLTCVRLLEVQSGGLVIDGHDLLDQTPILDIKPYLPYADAFPDSRQGWVEELPSYKLTYSSQAEAEKNWLESQLGASFVLQIERVLCSAPEGGPAHRIKRAGDTGEFVLALKTWRCHYQIQDGLQVMIQSFRSAYSRAEFETQDDPYGDKILHRSFLSHFPK